MKTTSFALMLLLSLILFGFRFTDPVSAASAPVPVRDTSGNILRSGEKYYILPPTVGAGGGLVYDARMGKVCPYNIVQESNSLSNGRPLTFTPVNVKKGAVRVSTDLNIKFSVSPPLCGSMVWKLSNFDTSTGQNFITIGGVEGNPGKDTVDNWFKIEKFEDGYKLVYCPSVCNFCKVMCRDVGLYTTSDGDRRLALSSTPYKVVFKKV